MSEMLTVKDSKTETIFSARDFEKLIRIHKGHDCAKYYHNRIKIGNILLMEVIT